MTSTHIWRQIFSLIISQFDDRKTQKKTDSGVGLEKRKNNLRKFYANYFHCPPSAQRHFVITFMCACGAPRSGSLSLRLLRYASTPLTGWSPRARYAKAALPIAYWLPSFFVNFTKVDTVLFIYVRLLSSSCPGHNPDSFYLETFRYWSMLVNNYFATFREFNPI